MDNEILKERLATVADDGFMGLAWSAKCRIEQLEKQVEELTQKVTKLIIDTRQFQ